MGSPKIRVATHLGEILSHLRGEKPLAGINPPAGELKRYENRYSGFDEVRGHPVAKRAMQVALAGGHHFLMVGSPGVGKSMLASAASSLMPPLEAEEFVEVSKIYGALGISLESLERPFRQPHHSISPAGLLGGGTGVVIPGEVSLAHRGILFLDEFPEYRKDAIQGLREPMESRKISLSRIGNRLDIPCHFILIAAMNPCPCGRSLRKDLHCECPPERVRSYRCKVSGPILDRIDLSVEMGMGSDGEGAAPLTEEKVRQTLVRAWSRQRERYRNGASRNAQVSLAQMLEFPEIKHSAWQLLESHVVKHRLSHRVQAKWMRVALTLSDLEGAKEVSDSHIYEAWGLRCRNFLLDGVGS